MIKNPNFKTVLLSLEGKILISSLGLFVIVLVIWGYGFARDAVLGRALVGCFVAHVFGGRGPAVGICIAFGMNISMTILYNMLIEVLIVLFTFSLFLISINHYLNIKLLDRFLHNVEKNAHKYEHMISKYGLIGIFVFVMIPLPVTGPVLGTIIAHFLKINLKKNLLVVFAGCLLAVVLWAIFFNFLSDHIAKIQWIFAVIIIAIIFSFLPNIMRWLSKKEISD